MGKIILKNLDCVSFFLTFVLEFFENYNHKLTKPLIFTAMIIGHNYFMRVMLQNLVSVFDLVLGYYLGALF